MQAGMRAMKDLWADKAGDAVLSAAEANQRTIRKADFVSCAVAFIDCKTPGSHLKQNYAMIGPGVTTNPDQVINLREPHGFNIGAAAMPHGIVNNLHMHFTAEVFMCLDGEYTFRWGKDGQDGTYVAHPGDVVSVPTWIFRGFTNTGPDDGWVYTCLGGDNTGGIIWHPSILAGAAEHGLYLTRDNILVDTSTGAAKPDDSALMPPISPADIATMRHYTPDDMARRVVARDERRFSSRALLDSVLPGHASEIASVIGFGITQDAGSQPKITYPHGFSMEWLRLAPGQSVSPFRLAEKQVLMTWRGVAGVVFNRDGDVSTEIETRDMVSVPAGVWRAIENRGEETLELLVITSGDGRKFPQFLPETESAALQAGIGIDPNAYLAPAHLLPIYRFG
jgi:mannose-6-phosphate isomerase-like protein (cupin superfamily)